MLLLLLTTFARAGAPVADDPDPAAPVPPAAEPSPEDPERQAELAPPPPVVERLPDDLLALRKNPDGSFDIVNGADRALTSDRFARLVGDIPYFVDTRRDQARVNGSRAALYVGGSVLLSAALLAVVVDGPRAPQETDYVADPDNYASYAEYDQAREELTAAYEEDYGRYREGRWFSAAFFAASGAFAIGTAPFLGSDLRQQRLHPHLMYTEKRAQGLVDRYNAAHLVIGVGTVGVTGSF